MSIIRLTVRTFQNVDHANMFIVMSEKIANESHSTDLKLNMKIIQNVDQKIKLRVYGNTMMKNI